MSEVAQRLRAVEAEGAKMMELHREGMEDLKERYEELLRKEERRGDERAAAVERECAVKDVEIGRLKNMVRQLEDRLAERGGVADPEREKQILKATEVRERTMEVIAQQRRVIDLHEKKIKHLEEDLQRAKESHEEQIRSYDEQLEKLRRQLSRFRSRAASESPPVYSPPPRPSPGPSPNTSRVSESTASQWTVTVPPPQDVKDLPKVRSIARMAPQSGYPPAVLKAMEQAGQTQEAKLQLAKVQAARRSLVPTHSLVSLVFSSFVKGSNGSNPNAMWDIEAFNTFLSTLHPTTPQLPHTSWASLCAALGASPYTGLHTSHLANLYATPPPELPISCTFDLQTDFMQLVDPQPGLS
eukprot:TRINITY_DN19087_c0_g1_i1.p1 TRINITY_DN19087_c0_g1~~TRINITY_DN19087_c0_g1_i1.p1  ORF type:complete len:374 (+),score=85.62 TRINITY_DN19087_c0_g1_i1:57-1124(+)